MADEVARRLVHASGTVVPAVAVVDPGLWPAVRAFYALGALAALGLEAVRLVAGLDWAIFDRLTREYEADNLAGYALYAISSAAVALAAPPLIEVEVAVAAILMLTIGDPISGLLGSGELRTAKQVWVLLAMFGVCTFIAGWFVAPVPAILGGAAATAADGLKPVVAGYVLDDNLTIPPAAAAAMVVGQQVVPVVV